MFQREGIPQSLDVRFQIRLTSEHITKFSWVASGDLHVNTLVMTITLGQNAHRDLSRL